MKFGFLYDFIGVDPSCKENHQEKSFDSTILILNRKLILSCGDKKKFSGLKNAFRCKIELKLTSGTSNHVRMTCAATRKHTHTRTHPCNAGSNTNLTSVFMPFTLAASEVRWLVSIYSGGIFIKNIVSFPIESSAFHIWTCIYENNSKILSERRRKH